MILTNELPRIADASTALPSRFIILPLSKSFLGEEDHHLTDRLIAELPGILNWALDGWDRLIKRGRFLQPPSGLDLIEELEDLGSPVGAFVASAAPSDRARTSRALVCSMHGTLGAKRKVASMPAPPKRSAATFAPSSRVSRSSGAAPRPMVISVCATTKGSRSVDPRPVRDGPRSTPLLSLFDSPRARVAYNEKVRGPSRARASSPPQECTFFVSPPTTYFELKFSFVIARH
jgi:hypothetical protein